MSLRKSMLKYVLKEKDWYHKIMKIGFMFSDENYQANTRNFNNESFD